VPLPSLQRFSTQHRSAALKFLARLTLVRYYGLDAPLHEIFYFLFPLSISSQNKVDVSYGHPA
jgi:hypothetical protein